VFVTKLDDDLALKKAADFMGEVFIFAVAGAAVAYEVNVSKAKDDAKAAATKAEKEAMAAQFKALGGALRDNTDRLAALEAHLQRLEEQQQKQQQRERTTRARWWPFAMQVV
jgi:predicted nuclease with TOPRIM domain